jgi:hypothetical protein
MKRYQTDSEWREHIENSYGKTEEVLRRVYQSDDQSPCEQLERTLANITNEKVRYLPFRFRVLTFLGTLSVVIGTFGGIAVLAFVYLQLGRIPFLELFGTTIQSMREWFFVILSVSSLLIGLTFIGYSLLRHRHINPLRLEGTVNVLFFGILAALTGAAVELLQAWIPPLITSPGTLAATGFIFGCLVAVGSGTYTKFIKGLSTLAVALTGIILFIIGALTIGFVSHLLAPSTYDFLSFP